MAALLAAVFATVVAWTWFSGRSVSAPPHSGSGAVANANASFVGSEGCAGCHQAEHQAWQGSQHARAMQHATEATVRGDFADAVFRHQGVQTTFFRRDGRFLVRTDGPDGRLADFEVKYTFGVEPLQQYLVELPGGRLQALSITWDTRPASAGGQRWFHQYPDERIDASDELHWTRRSQNWNFMCADCHSTGVVKGYDAAADTFATRWSEITVGCESCHGPGSAHVAWAARRSADPTKGLALALDERRGVSWRIDPATGNAERSVSRSSEREIQVCAQCHARRSQIAEGYSAGLPFLDHYLPALLTSPLYHADGQQRDEVFVWGSWMQSRMHRAGVTCSDCHDPHTQKLRVEGNGACAQCHAPAKYDASAHHHHPQGSAGAQCANCHMPAATYMVIDPRRDHSMRVPRPDLSISTGAPNACSSCHRDQDARWAADSVERWHGPQRKGFQRFAGGFHAADAGAAGAALALASIAGDASQSPIARASALARLRAEAGPRAAAAARSAGRDADPLVRLGALQAAALLPSPDRIAIAAPLLDDPLRSIRVEAAALLADQQAALGDTRRAAWTRAAEEYMAVQRFNADRPESRVALADFLSRTGSHDAAQAEFDAALNADPGFVPAYLNGAEALRAQGREADALQRLRMGVEKLPGEGALHHALGLAQVRAGQADAALRSLSRAAQLAPQVARYVYVEAVALESSGRRDDAIRVLEPAARRWPGDRDIVFALAGYQRDAGRPQAARAALAAFVAADPSDRDAQALLATLK
jgi:tetratricopeptide (TPR) repeat protein